MEYKSTISIIAIILLIICLIAIAIMLKTQRSGIVWPPEIGDCPDYWEKSGGSGGNKCVNTRDLGDIECSSEMNFDSIQEYQGESGKCQKYLWAKSCNVSWDGITNVGPICQEVASGQGSKL